MCTAAGSATLTPACQLKIDEYTTTLAAPCHHRRSRPAPPLGFTTALLAGGIAGTSVDLGLYPLDTLKTRLQSSEGFFATGGFRGLYRGVGSVVVGSAPGAALFFCTYEAANTALLSSFAGCRPHPDGSGGQQQRRTRPAGGRPPRPGSPRPARWRHARCACPPRWSSSGRQAGQFSSSLLALADILASRHRADVGGWRGVRRELYRGWAVTVGREVPFAAVQFPLWEALKAWGRRRRRRRRRQEDAHPADLGRRPAKNRGRVTVTTATLAGWRRPVRERPPVPWPPPSPRRSTSSRRA